MVFAVSKGSAREFQSVSQRLPCVLPNGIDDLFFAGPAVTKRRYLLFVGRPVEAKGFDVFEKAMLLVKEQVPDIEAVLVSNVVEDGVLRNIRTVRYHSREQLRSLYAEALVYVHAAIGESFGLPPLEAMASGTAAVITNTVGTSDYARDDFNCLAVEYGDPEALARKIVSLIQDPALRLRLEAGGRATAADYQWENSLRRFEAELLARPRLGSGTNGQAVSEPTTDLRR
jgi:glycosyltransferase involved in cell wall biosynthesis